MARIYISSTYSDLKEYREKVYRVIRQLGHDVIAMEDYVASDSRPLEKCLKDVSECDLYIGIFAWRYGYIPPNGNPEKKSITELEFRQAKHSGINCLFFLHDEKASWSPIHCDTGSNLKKIKSLRSELLQDYVVSFFETKDSLGAAVSVAVANWEKQREYTFANKKQPVGIHVMEEFVHQPYWSDYAPIRFSITNLSTNALKLTGLVLKVKNRKQIDAIMLKKAGAPLQEYEIVSRVDIHSTNVDLLINVKHQFVLNPNSSEAFRLALGGVEGYVFTLSIVVAIKNLDTGGVFSVESDEFDVQYPLRSLSSLQNR